MVAAEDLSLPFNPVAYYPAAAVPALGRQFLYSAFKTVKRVMGARIINCEAFVVSIPACIALAHIFLLPS